MKGGEQTFDRKSQGVLYGQKTETPHVMRNSPIIIKESIAEATPTWVDLQITEAMQLTDLSGIVWV